MKATSLAGSLIVAALVTAQLSTAYAAPTDAQKCEAAKNKVAGKYYFCREKADAKAILTGDPVDYSKCTAKFDEKWQAAEDKVAAACPDNVLTAPMNAYIASQATTTAAIIAGTQDIPAPGMLLKTGQTTAYGTGSDGDLQKGTAHSYTDNGDGTITDNVTGLMWEKKSDDGSIHDWDDAYTWSGDSYGGTNIMDGTITTTFLAALNGGGGFAGHTDWRIPNRKELESITNLENVAPAVDTAFDSACTLGCTVLTCSCTQSADYWSSTRYRGSPTSAWGVAVYGGFVSASGKSGNGDVRAVRGGS